MQVSPLAQASGSVLCALPYLQEVGDTSSRTCVLVHCMDLNDAAPSRCVLRGNSHRGQSWGSGRMLRELGFRGGHGNIEAGKWRAKKRWKGGDSPKEHPAGEGAAQETHQSAWVQGRRSTWTCLLRMASRTE